MIINPVGRNYAGTGLYVQRAREKEVVMAEVGVNGREPLISPRATLCRKQLRLPNFEWVAQISLLRPGCLLADRL
jgi:hypothetical protein